MMLDDIPITIQKVKNQNPKLEYHAFFRSDSKNA